MALPLLLAGPVVRRVDSKSAAFWIALSREADVEATVWQGTQTVSAGGGDPAPGGPKVALGSARTRPFGQNLHVAVVVASADFGGGGMGALMPGTLYSYDLTIDAGGKRSLRDLGLLKDATASDHPADVHPDAPRHLALGYATDRLPGFVTAGATIPDLRIAHASCRKGHGYGPDALAWLDDEIKDNLSDPVDRPQQLFLTGDQIYADEVGCALLPMLNEVGREVVGFTETLPIDAAMVEVTTDNLPPMQRQRLCREVAKFSSTSASNHLLSYAEFVGMYLAAFSPHAWRSLRGVDDILKDAPANAAALHLTDWVKKYGSVDEWKNKKDSNGKTTVERVEAETKRLEAWRDAVPRVARALANVATYMIFDDHEVTDDWNLTHSTRSKALTAPLGHAVIQNAMLAYAVFQAWGNDPKAFTHEGLAPPSDNEKLLDAIETFVVDGASTAATTRAALDTLLGMGAVLQEPKAVFHYSVPGPRHLVRVLDTRTRRNFVAEGLSPPRLLGSSLDSQLPKGPLGGLDLLIVVSAAPVLFPRLFDTLAQPVSASVFDIKHHLTGEDDGDDPEHPGKTIAGVEDKDVEGWHAVESAHEAFIRRLGTYPRVVILSGDVHFASSMVLDFWAKGDDAADSRVIQFTSSAARNQPNPSGKEVSAIRGLRFGQQMLRGRPFERLGWEDKPAIQVPAGASIPPGRRARFLRTPGLARADGWPPGTTIDPAKPPDWRWRLTVLGDARPNPPRRVDDQLVETLPAWNAADPIQSHADIAARHQQAAYRLVDPIRLMVFRNNLGVVSFAADGPDEYRVTHAILSAADETSGERYTEHSETTARAGLVAPSLKTS
jgi:hypothetical protein